MRPSPALRRHGGSSAPSEPHCSATSEQRWPINAVWAETRALGGSSAVMANNYMHFDTLAEHSPVNSRRYAAVLSILIKGFEKRIQDCQKNQLMPATPFSVYVNTLLAGFQKERRVASRHWIQKSDHVSPLDFYKPCLFREKYPLLHNYAFFMSLLFGSMWLVNNPFQKSLANTLRTH